MVGTGEIGKPHSSAMSSGVFAAIAHAFSSALEAIINFAGQFFTGKSLENRRTKVEAKEKLTFDFSDKEETANALRKAFGAITPQQYGNMLLRGSKNINFNVDDAGQMTANVEYFDNTTPSDKNLSVDSIREARIFDENMGDPADYRATKMGILAAIDGTQAEGNLTRRNVSVVIGGRELCKKNADGSYNENFWLEVTKALRDFVEEKCAGKSEDEKEKFMLHVLQALCGACKGPNPILGWLVCRGLKSFAAAGDTACIQADLDENTGKYLKITIGDTGVECEQTSRRQVSLQKGIRSTELPFFLEERLKTWTSFNDPLMRKIDTSSGVTLCKEVLYMPENDEYVAIETREKDEYVVMYEPRKKSELIAEIRPALETVDEDSVLNITQASAKSSENVNAWSTRSSHDNVGLYEVKTQPNEVEMQPMGIHTDFNDPESAGKFVVECFRAISPDAYTNVATNAGTGNAWFKFSLDSDGKLIANENISEITEPSRSTAEREITVERLAANGAFNYDNPVDFFTLAKGTMLSIDFPRTRMNLSVDGEPLSFDVENSQNKSPEEVQAEVGCRITDKLLKLADKVCNERHAHEADVDRIITGKSPEQWLEQREAEKKELFCKYMRAMCCAFKGQNDLKISKSLSEALSAFADDQGNRNQIFTSSTHNDFSANISVDRNGVTCSQEIFTLSNILKAHSRTRIISENSQGNANEGKELIPIVIDEKISFYASIDNPLERKLIPSGTSIALFDLNASAGGSAEMGSSRVNANGNPLESAKGKKIFEIRANGNFMPPIA